MKKIVVNFSEKNKKKKRNKYTDEQLNVIAEEIADEICSQPKENKKRDKYEIARIVLYAINLFSYGLIAGILISECLK